MTIRAVGVCLRRGKPDVVSALRHLLDWLEARQIEVFADATTAEVSGRTGVSPPQMAAESDLVVVLGGDGTLLRVARELGTRRIPILGVNLGTLGYLTEFSVDEMIPAVQHVLDGDYELQSRLRLEVEVERAHLDTAETFLALNEAVVSTRAAKMIDLETRADGASVTTYHADGLIVSTPTGSTAYSLSAGGPILLPGTNALLLTPICPHTLTQRPLVLAADTVIEIEVRTRGSEVTLTVDGQEEFNVQDGDLVRVRRSPHEIALVASPFHSRFEILRNKLHWGQR